MERELESFAGDEEVADQARSLLAFVQQADDRTHRHLKFIGD